MRKAPLFICFFASTLFASEEGFVPLFDGETLAGWTSARSSEQGDWGPFSVTTEEKAIHVYAGEEPNSEQESDCLNTDAEYSHYILRMEYKWLGPRFEPRTDWDRDAGLLFHVHGNLKKVWPLSFEMQIGESPGDKPTGKGPQGRFHSGDLFVLGKNLRSDSPRGEGGFYDQKAPLRTGKHLKTRLGVENPLGEWNEVEIRVYGSEKATLILNGEIVLETFNMVTHEEDGSRIPVDSGRIGLQAEWAEILYRNIRIKELPVE